MDCSNRQLILLMSTRAESSDQSETLNVEALHQRV